MITFYAIPLLMFMTSLYASQEPEGGKLPDNFKFKAASEERRSNFMSQWNDYCKEKGESDSEEVSKQETKEEAIEEDKPEKRPSSTQVLASEQHMTIVADCDTSVFVYADNEGNTHIVMTPIKKD